MIDAYQIGISLTLENGVSDGLALIRQDLATLDKAIGATEARLAGLAQAARQSLVPPALAPVQSAPPQPAAASGTGVDPSPVRPGAVEPVAATRPVSVPSVSAEATERPGPARGPDPVIAATIAVPPRAEAPAAVPAIAPAAPARDIVGPAPAAPVSPQVAASAPAPVTARVRQPEAGGPDLQARTARVVEAPRPIASQALASRQAPVPPVTPREVPGAAPSAVRAAIPQILAEAARPVPVVARATPGSLPASPATGAVSRQDSLRVAARFGPSEDGATGGRPREPRAMPPQERGIERGAVPPREQAAPVAPRTRQADSQSQTGDVFLDGEKVGRWMIDHLASAASRPSAAATGFDARATPPWNIAGLL